MVDSTLDPRSNLSHSKINGENSNCSLSRRAAATRARDKIIVCSNARTRRGAIDQKKLPELMFKEKKAIYQRGGERLIIYETIIRKEERRQGVPGFVIKRGFPSCWNGVEGRKRRGLEPRDRNFAGKSIPTPEPWPTPSPAFNQDEWIPEENTREGDYFRLISVGHDSTRRDRGIRHACRPYTPTKILIHFTTKPPVWWLTSRWWRKPNLSDASRRQITRAESLRFLVRAMLHNL